MRVIIDRRYEFEVGDKVIYDEIHAGTIVGIINNHEIIVRLVEPIINDEFDDTELQGPYIITYEHQLKLDEKHMEKIKHTLNVGFSGNTKAHVEVPKHLFAYKQEYDGHEYIVASETEIYVIDDETELKEVENRIQTPEGVEENGN